MKPERISGLDEDSWDELVGFIRDENCTPFLGAGASAGSIKAARALSQEWADRYGYPLKDSDNLARVAQFLALEKHDMFPRDEIGKVVRGTEPPQFARDDDPHGVLARLKLPLYLTTNYDDFMVRALIARGADARWDICRWNDSPAVKAVKTPLRRPYVPSPERPLVFHLHGHYQVPQSLVITEDDYLEFLAAIIRDEKQRLLPPPLPERVTGTALLFVGYSLTDWTFRVLLRSLKNSFTARLAYPALAIQLDPADVADKESLAEARTYLTRYLGEVGLRSRLRIAWGKAGDFARELEGRLKP